MANKATRRRLKSRRTLAREWKKRFKLKKIKSIEESLPLPELEVETENPIEEFELTGRRIVDIKHLFTTLKSLEHNTAFGCSFYNITIIGEQRTGFKSTFLYKCDMCGLHSSFTIDIDHGMNINDAFVLGAISSGGGMSHIEHISASLNLSPMSKYLYTKCSEKIYDYTEKLAYNSMLLAGKEEYRLAVECGDIIDGKPAITVVVDGAWSKRSYRTNYNASSGVACIIGVRTKKVLYIGVKNKACAKCQWNETKQQSTVGHKCYKNWTETSTSMEGEIILEGFQISEQMHNLRYARLIGDGDSSVYRKLVKAQPYGPDFRIEKIECRNHILRRYCNKLRELSRTAGGNVQLRNLLRRNLLRLRVGIMRAIKYRKIEQIPEQQKIDNLRNDILNSPKHIFGDHTNCDHYYCKTVGQIDPSMIYDKFVSSSLYKNFKRYLDHVANHSKSLLYDMDTNLAELFNAIVNKMVGGKRINYTKTGSYTNRCLAAVLNYNHRDSGGGFTKNLTSAMNNDQIGRYTQLYFQQQNQKLRYHMGLKKKSKVVCVVNGPDGDYGRESPIQIDTEGDTGVVQEEQNKQSDSSDDDCPLSNIRQGQI